MRWAEHVACKGDRGGTSRVLVRKSEGKTPLGRHIYRCMHNIKMDLQELRWRAWASLIWITKRRGGRVV